MDASYCPNCGKSLSGAVVCPKCGLDWLNRNGNNEERGETELCPYCGGPLDTGRTCVYCGYTDITSCESRSLCRSASRRCGWKCPSCGRVYSPDVKECSVCNVDADKGVSYCGGISTYPGTTIGVGSDHGTTIGVGSDSGTTYGIPDHGITYGISADHNVSCATDTTSNTGDNISNHSLISW